METLFEELKGKVLVSIKGLEKGSKKVSFVTSDEKLFNLQHHEETLRYENVTVEDVCGDVEDLLNTPILLAEKVTNVPEGFEEGDDNTEWKWKWTFYKLSTIKGSVTIRWYGESGIWYSADVSFERVLKL